MKEQEFKFVLCLLKDQVGKDGVQFGPVLIGGLGVCTNFRAKKSKVLKEQDSKELSPKLLANAPWPAWE